MEEISTVEVGPETERNPGAVRKTADLHRLKVLAFLILGVFVSFMSFMSFMKLVSIYIKI